MPDILPVTAIAGGTDVPSPDQARVEQFERLHSLTYRAVAAYVARRCDSPADAADTIAETYLVAWRRLDHVPLDGSPLPWLYGVSRKVLANQRRGQRRNDNLIDRLTHQLRPGAMVRAPELTQGEQLRRALASLSESDRELLMLVAWEQLGRDELATALRLSRSTVRVRLHRARRRFAEALAREGVEIPVSAVPTSDPAPAWAVPQEAQ